MRPALLALASLAAACTTATGPECGDGVTCLSGEVCTDTRECVDPAYVQRVVVHWTIGGAPPTTASCAAYPALSLTLYASTTLTELTYAPLVCPAGQFTFQKLGEVYDSVTLGSGGPTATAAIPRGGGDVAVDLPAF